MRLPEILESFVPVRTGKHGKNANWVIDGGNGTHLVVAVGKRKGGESPTVITMYRSRNKDHYPLSPKRNAPESLGGHIQPIGEILRLPQDTPAEPSVRQQQSQRLSNNIHTITDDVNSELSDWRGKPHSEEVLASGVDKDTGISFVEKSLPPEQQKYLSDKYSINGERINEIEKIVKEKTKLIDCISKLDRLP